MDKISQNNAVIYLRTSTEEQDPELQRKDCIDFCKINNLNVINVFVEKKSAYKDNVERTEWDKCVQSITVNKYHLVVFRYDRTWRNEKSFVEFMKEMYILHELKVYSITDNYLNEIWNITKMLEKIPAPFDILMKAIMNAVWSLVVSMTGKKAEEESSKKSKSIMSAIVKKGNQKTKSKYGNKWGRRSLPKQTREKIIDLSSQGKSIREISSLVKTTDKNKNMVPVSKSAVHKILADYSKEKSSNLECL